MDDDCGDNSDEPFHECSKHLAGGSYLNYGALNAKQTALLNLSEDKKLLERIFFCKLLICSKQY